MNSNRLQYKVRFTLSDRHRPVLPNYRPNWTAQNKPDQNCAALFFEDKESISLGENHICYLEPLSPELWHKVKINDILKCMEGSREVGEALVLDILDNKVEKFTFPHIIFSSKKEEEEYSKSLKDAGFHTITIGSAINIDEIKRRRFNIKE